MALLRNKVHVSLIYDIRNWQWLLSLMLFYEGGSQIAKFIHLKSASS